jgi:hypothetical protein
LGTTPVLQSGPFAGLPDLNAIYPNGPQTGIVSESTALSPAPQATGSWLDPSTGQTGSATIPELPSLDSGIPTFSTTVTSTPLSSTSAPSSGCAWYDLSCEFQNSGLAAQQDTSNITAGVPSGLSAPVTQAIPSAVSSLLGNSFAGFSWGRIGGFLLGLILIAAGLYLFGSQSSTVRSVVRASKGLAA